ncbi:MAG: hypothetical protein QNJ70_01480 [Xenococcaceae cyanobacterium MO_207.B15]|nr:hypothetical protein [Xenococcaceae cyanobacterium MO_207.B15]
MFDKHCNILDRRKIEIYTLWKKIDGYVELKIIKYLISVKVLQKFRIFASAIKHRLLHN